MAELYRLCSRALDSSESVPGTPPQLGFPLACSAKPLPVRAIKGVEEVKRVALRALRLGRVECHNRQPTQCIDLVRYGLQMVPVHALSHATQMI